MTYNATTSDRIRQYLVKIPTLEIEEKKMFRGLTFMVKGKMCVGVSGENLMCRFDPSLTREVNDKPGVLPMVMRGKTLQGYCYVRPEGFQEQNDFLYWVNLCLDYNDRAKGSKR